MNPIVKKILLWGLKMAYDFVDKNNDGKISLEELETQVYDPVMKLIKKINLKRNK